MSAIVVNTNLPNAPSKYDPENEANTRRIVQSALKNLANPGPLLATSYTPANSADGGGSVGQIAYDANYVYVKTATGAWKRAALATF